MTRKSTSLLQLSLIIVAVYVIPILLMLTEVLPSVYKYHVLIGMSVILALYAQLTRISLPALGFTQKNFRVSMARVLPPSLLVAVVILILFFLGWFRSDSPSAHWSFYIFYIFISATLQEFIYRGFLIHLLQGAQVNQRATIFMSAALYGFMHIIFDVPSVLVTFIIGLFWAWVYVKDRNIYSVTFSHALLGALSLLANFS